MLKAVLDTNVLVSALWSPSGNAAAIISLIFSARVIPCFDHNILNEYRAVLSRPRLAFPQGQVNQLLTEITDRGVPVIVSASTAAMPDESDRKFYDVARFCGAYLVTGNAKHYPQEPFVVSPAGFLRLCKY